MIYAYKCRRCGLQVDSSVRADTIGPCTRDYPIACSGELTRLFQVTVEPAMQEHFNSTTASVISSSRQFDEEMKRQTDIQSARLGMDVQYERVDPSNKAALGVTDEGIDASNRIRREQGLPTFKT